MTAGPLPPASATSAPAFRVERFEWTAPDRLEVTGRWFGVRGRRFMRPTLDVRGAGDQRRLLAVLDHKPWAAEDGQRWVAAFPWDGGHVELSGAELAVGPGVEVQLGPPRRPPGYAPPVHEPPPPPAESDETLHAARQTVDAALRDRGELERARDAAIKARDAALADRDALVRERFTADREREAAVRDLANAAREIEAVSGQRDQLARELEALRAASPATPQDGSIAADLREELEALRRERDSLRAQRDHAERDRDTARRDRDAALAAQGEAENQRDAAAERLEDALHARDAAERQRDAAERERDAAIHERDEAELRARPAPAPAAPAHVAGEAREEPLGTKPAIKPAAELEASMVARAVRRADKTPDPDHGARHIEVLLARVLAFGAMSVMVVLLVLFLRAVI